MEKTPPNKGQPNAETGALMVGEDDFDREVEMLRGSQAFHQFLDERSRSTRRIRLEDIEAENDREPAREEKRA
jgi:hypothetical protein